MATGGENLMAGFPTISRFTAARDAWWTARSRGGGAAGASATARAATSKERQWALSGKRYLRAYKGLDGQIIRFPAELLQLVAERIEAIAPRLSAAYDSELGRFALDAWREWPVATGLSRSLLDVEVEQRGETLHGRVVSRAPYTVFIKGRGGSVYQNLLRKPGRELPARIVAALEASRGE